MSAVVKTQFTTGKRGRPRSTVRHQAILESTRALLLAGSYDQLTIEAIASEAGVSKQTIYKWWPSKAAVVTEAIIAGQLSVGADPPADTGDVVADLRAWMRARAAQLDDPRAVALVRAMTAASADTADVAEADDLYEQLAGPYREYVMVRLRAAVQHGQLRSDVDLDAAVDAIAGTVTLWTLSRGRAGSLDRAEGLIDILFHGMATERRPGA